MPSERIAPTVCVASNSPNPSQIDQVQTHRFEAALAIVVIMSRVVFYVSPIAKVKNMQPTDVNVQRTVSRERPHHGILFQ
jgi:hypothetical protein